MLLFKVNNKLFYYFKKIIFISINIYLYFAFVISYNVHSESINVSNEREFKKALDLKYSDIILTSSFSIEENYILFSGNSIKISGIEQDIALTFTNENNEIQFNEFNSIEISNITYNGNINIINCNETLISNINFNGIFTGNFDKNQLIIFDNIKYHNLQNKISEYGFIFNNGEIEINNSYIYGSNSISNYIFMLNNQNDEKMTNTFLKIYNSHISGEYTCGIIKSINSYVLLYQTYVENAFSANGYFYLHDILILIYLS